MANWAPADDDRSERIVEDVHDRPEVTDVEHDDETITISFGEQTTLPEGFDEWADANELVIRDVEVQPDIDGFAVQLAFTDEVEALSSLRTGVDNLRQYLDADHSPAARRRALMAARGPFGGWGGRSHGDAQASERLRAACNHLHHQYGKQRRRRFQFGEGDPRRFDQR